MDNDSSNIRKELLSLGTDTGPTLIESDPRLLMTAASNNGVLPMIHAKLMEICVNTPSFDIIKVNSTRVAAINVRNEFLTSKALFVLALLEKESIRAVLFKGPEIALRAYGSVGMRQFDDIDLIIPTGDILKARSVLLRNGFIDKQTLSEKEMQHQIKYGWGLGIVSADGDYIVELDSGVLHHYQSLRGLDEPAIWGRAVEYDINGTHVRVLPPELELMMLCVHGTKHCWERMVWIADVAGLVARQPVDWGFLIRESRQTGCLVQVLVGLELIIRCIAGAKFPSIVTSLIDSEEKVNRLAGWVEKSLVACDSLEAVDELKFNMSSRDRFGDCAGYLMRYVCLPSFGDLRRFNLPESLEWLYYLLRPIRLVTDRWFAG